MESDNTGWPFLCIHGHFYQPPREDRFTGVLLSELGAEPYRDFNAKITAECYRPNFFVTIWQESSPSSTLRRCRHLPPGLKAAYLA